MNIKELKIEQVKENKDIPFKLLKMADPSREQIESYLKTGSCYIAKHQSKLIGVLVLNSVNSTTIEIKNIAIKESEQGKGFGKVLLQQAENLSKELGYKKLIIGTGNSSIGQLALYQKSGFEIDRIDKNFFLKNYKEPIFENGIQCKHMVVLEKKM
ncbi:GNAT family N-acetyltransferase [Tenacibaculum xiamenense]|uniref:GNAT family N-acetyltransferase n=1 Tax=Tenacibaculum xiamenense TaxID=1261553 RepID=UPI003894F994